MELNSPWVIATIWAVLLIVAFAVVYGATLRLGWFGVLSAGLGGVVVCLLLWLWFVVGALVHGGRNSDEFEFAFGAGWGMVAVPLSAIWLCSLVPGVFAGFVARAIDRAWPKPRPDDAAAASSTPT